MESEPTSQVIPPGTLSPAPDIHKSSKKIKYIILGILFLIILVIVGILLWNSVSKKIENTNRINHGPGKYSQEQWKTYKAPDGDFSISIPSSWPVSPFTDGGTTSGTDSSGKTSMYTTKTVVLGIPYNTTSDFINLNIRINKPASDACWPDTPNKNISGFPAFYDDTVGQWYINTNKAMYNLAPSFTGDDGFVSHPLAYVPPSVSQNFIDANQAIINKVISSFKPLNQTPYSCK